MSEPAAHPWMANSVPALEAAMLAEIGAGCWQHHVPAVVDEIVGRFVLPTNVWGSPQSDFGRNQAWFEHASQLGELVGMEVVSLPVYSWGCAAGHVIRMAAWLTGRRRVLLPAVLDPERRAMIASYCEPTAMRRCGSSGATSGRWCRPMPGRSAWAAMAWRRRPICRCWPTTVWTLGSPASKASPARIPTVRRGGWR